MIYLALRIGLFLSLFLLLFASDEYHSRQRSNVAYDICLRNIQCSCDQPPKFHVYLPIEEPLSLSLFLFVLHVSAAIQYVRSWLILFPSSALLRVTDMKSHLCDDAHFFSRTLACIWTCA